MATLKSRMDGLEKRINSANARAVKFHDRSKAATTPRYRKMFAAEAVRLMDVAWRQTARHAKLTSEDSE